MAGTHQGNLTRQRIKDAIAWYTDAYHTSPSIADLALRLGMKRSGVQRSLRTLIDAGVVTRDAAGKLALTQTEPRP